LHVPKGTVPAVEAAFAVIPPNRRDSWRLHRVQEGETFAALSKRYNAQAVSLSSANHDLLPAAGEWAAIPTAYPGDRVPKPVVAHRRTASPTAKKRTGTAATAKSATPKSDAVSRSAPPVKTAPKTTTSKSGAGKSTAGAHKKPAPATHKSTGKASAHRKSTTTQRAG